MPDLSSPPRAALPSSPVQSPPPLARRLVRRLRRVPLLRPLLDGLHALVELPRMRHDLYALRAEIGHLQARIAPPQPMGESATAAAHGPRYPDLAAWYQDFEEHFRGPPAAIRERLQVYLPPVAASPVASATPLLDLGCGRGDWLALLREAGHPAYGIDTNPSALERARQRGLDVREAEALEHLAALPEAALGAVSALHLVEHLPFESVLLLIDAARRALVPGGLLIIETPNPENLSVGACHFYLDPTHRRPLAPAVLEFAVTRGGFADIEVLRLNPVAAEHQWPEDSELARRCNAVLNGPRDCAVLARKPAAKTLPLRRPSAMEEKLARLGWTPGAPPAWPIKPDPAAASRPFMPYSTCSAGDFLHPRFAEISRLINLPPFFHRKNWEWIYILNAALTHGINAPGKRALGFGVGTEPIPAVLAKYGVRVTATDAPSAIGVSQGWMVGAQYAESAEHLTFEGILDRDTFMRLVDYRAVDMNAIDPDLTGYDFCWSSCALEHLGSLRHGLNFILNSVENTLKVGGIACHTTEYNLSSNDETVETGSTVLYRRRDIEALIAELRGRGHAVSDFVLAPDAHILDRYVDVPPYSSHGHLKLLLEGHAATSMGLMIRRGGLE